MKIPAFVKENLMLIAFCASIAIIVLPLFIFLTKFSGWYLSEDQEKWAHFGDFMNVWVSVASLCLLSGIAVGIHINEEKSEENRKEVEAARNRPLLVCKSFQGAGGLKIRNIGNGPAINVFFTCSVFPDEDTYQHNLTRLDPIGIGEEIQLEGDLRNNTVLISYEDIFGNIISSTYERSELYIEVGKDVLNNFIKFDAQSLMSFNTGFDLDL